MAVIIFNGPGHPVMLPDNSFDVFLLTIKVLHRNAYLSECQPNLSSRSGMSVIGPHFGLPVDVQRDASRPSMARSTAASMPYKAL